MKLHEVTKVNYLGDYRVFLAFEDGKKGEFDFAPLLKKKPFNKIKSEREFIQFGLEYGTLVWTNGLDISPSFLYKNLH